MSVSSINEPRPWLETSQRSRLDSSTPVSRLMSSAPPQAGVPGIDARGIPSVHALTSVREATHLMASRGVLHLHVKDNLGNVVGVLTVSDLYRWVAAAQAGDYDDGPTAGHA